MALRRVLDRDEVIADAADMAERADRLAGVVEQGLPEDLIRAGGPFAELFGDEALAA